MSPLAPLRVSTTRRCSSIQSRSVGTPDAQAAIVAVSVMLSGVPSASRAMPAMSTLLHPAVVASGTSSATRLPPCETRTETGSRLSSHGKERSTIGSPGFMTRTVPGDSAEALHTYPNRSRLGAS